MPTTTPSSESARALALTLLAAALVGCGAPERSSLFQRSPDSARHRAAQTRLFETTDELELLSAAAAVLQDLGFQVEEAVPEVGLLRAAKERGAREYGQEITQGLVLALTGALSRQPVLMAVPLHQQIGATLVTRPAPADPSRFAVRVLFYRSIWSGEGSEEPPGRHRVEVVRDAAVYRRFFAKLAKSLFLEAQEL